MESNLYDVLYVLDSIITIGLKFLLIYAISVWTCVQRKG